MSTEIYYFSGTGNSLAVARDIAEKLGGKLISIASVMDEERIITDADVIGVVFPTYYEPYGGVPLIVRRFVKKLENIGSKYIFAICTYGGASVKALNCLDKIINLNGGKLEGRFTVNMPSNMYGPKINNTKNQQKMFSVWKENIQVIYGILMPKKKENLIHPTYLLVGLIH